MIANDSIILNALETLCANGALRIELSHEAFYAVARKSAQWYGAMVSPSAAIEYRARIMEKGETTIRGVPIVRK